MSERTVTESVGIASHPGVDSRMQLTLESLSRVVIENVRPQIDGGRFAIKRVVDEEVEVTADIFADGHDLISTRLLYRLESDPEWSEVSMRALGNDRWSARFPVRTVGVYLYTVEAWIDHFASWSNGFQKKYEAGQEVAVELLIAAEMVQAAASRASGNDRTELERWRKELLNPGSAAAFNAQLALDQELLSLMQVHSDRSHTARFGPELRVVVDTVRARFSSWYEFFPRSTSREAKQHGTLEDAARHLSYVAEMGFNVVYLPPIHPIGQAFRKGKNNTPVCDSNEVGSPWAIGGVDGGHKAIHPELGSIEDFRSFVKTAKGLGLDVALDIAFQVSPDHPYVKEHQQWFRWRPDKTVQYAENPPKKYQDIYPFEFENPDWRGLWEELKQVFLFWVEQGVHIFRVDNPHTKPFAFWEWLIAEVKQQHPDVIFLAEAFTRPKIMYRLAKSGFSQSYTYFTWRNSKAELTEYLQELTREDIKEYFRPNLWPNTPDILTEQLQHGGRAAFISRLVLAGTLSSNFGIYGPAYELMVNVPTSPGKEEYLDSEKYEIKQWDLEREDSLKPMIARVNAARDENPALQSNQSLQFHQIDNEQLIAYSKTSGDLTNVVVTVVNLDTQWTQSGWLHLPLEALGLDGMRPYIAHDLLSDARYQWFGPTNFVELNPDKINAHILQLSQGE